MSIVRHTLKEQVDASAERKPEGSSRRNLGECPARLLDKQQRHGEDGQRPSDKRSHKDGRRQRVGGIVREGSVQWVVRMQGSFAARVDGVDDECGVFHCGRLSIAVVN